MRRIAFVAFFIGLLLSTACTNERPGERKVGENATSPPKEQAASDKLQGAKAAPPLPLEASIVEFEAELARWGLDGVVPTAELLRTATDWKKCGGPEFEIPPRAQWPEVGKVLALVAELKKRRILQDFEAM